MNQKRFESRLNVKIKSKLTCNYKEKLKLHSIFIYSIHNINNKLSPYLKTKHKQINTNLLI